MIIHRYATRNALAIPSFRNVVVSTCYSLGQRSSLTEKLYNSGSVSARYCDRNPVNGSKMAKLKELGQISLVWLQRTVTSCVNKFHSNGFACDIYLIQVENVQDQSIFIDIVNINIFKAPLINLNLPEIS